MCSEVSLFVLSLMKKFLTSNYYISNAENLKNFVSHWNLFFYGNPSDLYKFVEGGMKQFCGWDTKWETVSADRLYSCIPVIFYIWSRLVNTSPRAHAGNWSWSGRIKSGRARESWVLFAFSSGRGGFLIYK